MIRAVLGSAIALMLIAVGLARTWSVQAAPGAMKMKQFTFLNVELEGSRIWLPGVVILKRGEEVSVKLVNKHKDQHGFAADELGVQAVVDGAATKELTIKPTRAGTFRLYCHLHPAHIGGQIVVNP